MKMTNEERIAWLKEEGEKYAKSVAAKWAASDRPTNREMAVIHAQFPGYRTVIESFIDISINETALIQAREIIAALDMFDVSDRIAAEVNERALAEVRALYAKAQADWPAVEGDDQYVALGGFLDDLKRVLG